MVMSAQRIAFGIFDAAFTPVRRRGLHAIHVTGLPRRIPDDDPVLLASNHVSWWDGFLLREVQRLLRPRAPICVPMTLREYERRPWLRWLGALPLQPGSIASVRRALRALAARRRQDPTTCFLFFPQGAIWPATRRPLGFQRGVEWLARTLAPVTVLPVAIHIEPLNRRVPTAFVSVGDPVVRSGAFLDVRVLEREVASQLDAIHAFLGRHGEASPARWPGPHGRLPSDDADVSRVCAPVAPRDSARAAVARIAAGGLR
jgi:1-acyl-sn-glycerol-3-phosphate acyltransferase